MNRASALVGGGLAAAAARGAYAVLQRHPPGGAQAWRRTNYRGEPVTLLEGPAVAAAAVAAALLTPGLPGRIRAAVSIATAGACAFGRHDDVAGGGQRRGFRGHLGALAHGELTSGIVKLAGIGLTGAAAGAMLGGPPADVAINACLTAGGANLVNLFDLRPGRALKVTALAGSALGTAAAPAVGAALAMLPEDLAERAMLGDAGANALGAMLGVAAGVALPRPARVAAVAVIGGLTAASEIVSFTRVIERTPALRWADLLGRRPAGPAAARPHPVPPPAGAGSAPRRGAPPSHPEPELPPEPARR